MKAAASSQIPVRGAEIWPISVEAYHVLGEAGLIPKRAELLYGFVYHKTSKSPFQAYLLRVLHQLLLAAVSDGYIVGTEQPITCVDSEPEPDLSVVRGQNIDFRHEHPRTAELIIEICVTSHSYDRSKLRAYAQAGVKECWLVLGPEKQIEVHHSPQAGHYTRHTVHGPSGHVTSMAVPAFTVDLGKLFA